MTKKISRRRLEDLVEKLAAIEHQRWSHWQNYMHSQCARMTDGSLVIPSDLAEKWQTQCETLYDRLDQEEKQSDRDQVMRYLPTVLEALDTEGE